MTLDRPTLETYVAKLNAQRRPELAIRIESFDEKGRFVLSYPDRAMPEGQCIDQDFTDIQFALFEDRDLSTNIVGGERRDDDRYHMQYELVVWD